MSIVHPPILMIFSFVRRDDIKNIVSLCVLLAAPTTHSRGRAHTLPRLASFSSWHQVRALHPIEYGPAEQTCLCIGAQLIEK